MFLLQYRAGLFLSKIAWPDLNERDFAKESSSHIGGNIGTDRRMIPIDFMYVGDKECTSTSCKHIHKDVGASRFFVHHGRTSTT
jgi:hypothetical protein